MLSKCGRICGNLDATAQKPIPYNNSHIFCHYISHGLLCQIHSVKMWGEFLSPSPIHYTPHENVVEPKSKIRLNLGSWPCAGSLFFCQRKIKGYRNPIRRSVPYFFLVLSPRIAQDSRLRLWECNLTTFVSERSESHLWAFIWAY